MELKVTDPRTKKERTFQDVLNEYPDAEGRSEHDWWPVELNDEQSVIDSIIMSGHGVHIVIPGTEFGEEETIAICELK